MPAYEEFDSQFDPHRAEWRASAAAEVRARLWARGIAVTGTESAEDLEHLLSVVERFEAAVVRHFVVPRRERGESASAYIGRIAEATDQLRHQPLGERRDATRDQGDAGSGAVEA